MKPQHFIILLLLVSGYFLYLVYEPFVQAIAIAILLMFATLGISKQVSKRVKKRWQMSAVMTILLGVMFFAPLVYLINAAATLVVNIDTNTIMSHLNKIESFLHKVELPKIWLERLNISSSTIDETISNLFSEEYINSYIKSIGSFLGVMAAHSAVFFKDMVLILIFYFFAYYYSDDISDLIKRVLPLKRSHTQLLFTELSNSMGVVFFSILITAIFEGSLFALIAIFFGLDAILLGILYGFASLVPLIGGALMWVPVSLYLWSTQGPTAAIIVAIYSLIVISITADTFIKPLIIKWIDHKLHNDTKTLNEILVFFSIIAGLATFGFWGMIIGPAITTLFIAILKLYDQLQNQHKGLIR